MQDLADAQAEMERLRLHVEKLQFVIAYLSGNEPSSASRTVSNPASDVSVDSSARLLSKDSPLFGRSLAEAAIYALSQLGKPSSDSEIVARLTELGWKFPTNKSAPTNVYWALRENSIKYKNVLTIPGPKWKLPSWGIPESKHAVKARQSLNVARANGVVLGPKPKVTPEMEVQLKELLDQGMPVAVAARKMNISSPTVYRFIKRITEPAPDLVDVARSVIVESDDKPADAAG